MFIDLDLAKRLERTEGMVGASFVDARNAVSAATAETRTIAGTIAVFDGPDSPLTQTFGLGLFGAADDGVLSEIETFFTERGADALHEVSPHAGVDVLARLAARGYVPVELGTVLVRPIGDPVAPSSALQARVIDPAVDGDAWVEASIAGWTAEPGVAAFIRNLASVNVQNRAMTHYLVEHDGEPIATGSLGIHDGVALLAGASTIPAARGRGAQGALLARRLADARTQGCELAMMITNVGSQSQRNAERNGFRIAYTRTKWKRLRVS